MGTADNWRDLADAAYIPVEVTSGSKSYNIYPLLGTDAVHGNQHTTGTVLFPHNIGLAATHNPKNFYDAGFYTS
jgi:beta-glucosidase